MWPFCILWVLVFNYFSMSCSVNEANLEVIFLLLHRRQTTQSAQTWHDYPYKSCTAVIHDMFTHDQRGYNAIKNTLFKWNENFIAWTSKRWPWHVLLKTTFANSRQKHDPCHRPWTQNQGCSFVCSHTIHSSWKNKKMPRMCPHFASSRL